MKNGFKLPNGQKIDIIGATQLSIGEGLQLDNRFSFDYSKRPQSIVRRRKKTARTATLTMQIARAGLVDKSLFEVLADFEQIVGQTGELYWNSQNEGSFCVRSASFSFAIDAIDIVPAAQIALEMTESFQRTGSNQRPKQAAHVELF